MTDTNTTKDFDLNAPVLMNEAVTKLAKELTYTKDEANKVIAAAHVKVDKLSDKLWEQINKDYPEHNTDTCNYTIDTKYVKQGSVYLTRDQDGAEPARNAEELLATLKELTESFK